MRKKFYVVLLAIIMLISFAIVITACDGFNPNEPSDSSGDNNIDMSEHTEHTWYNWRIITPATCESEGSKERTCRICRVKETEIIPAGHALQTMDAKAPTCTTVGWNEYEYCTICDYSAKVELPATGHSIQTMDTQTPTCTEVGWDAYEYCTKCDYTTCKQISALGHTEVIETAVSPTCQATGLTEGKYCSVCNQILVQQEVVGKSAHDFDENAVCSVCDLDTSHLNVYNGTYGYNYFSTIENGINYRKLYKDIDNWARTIHTSDTDITEYIAVDYSAYNLTAEQAVAVWKTFKDDNPLYYWLSNTISYTDTEIQLIIRDEYKLAEQRNAYNELVYSKVDEYSARISTTDGEYRIALAFHDFIIDDIEYAYSSDGSPESAEWAHNVIGVFNGIGAVCEGYARSFNMLLNYNGVENLYVTGIGGGEDHAWNLVKLDDDNWYWFDLTFDDLGKDTISWNNDIWGIGYTFFAAQDANFLSYHTAHTPSGSDITFLYELPARATSKFVADYPLLNHKFELNNAKYTIVGYNAVQLNFLKDTGSVILPETVQYGDVNYTLISIGNINDEMPDSAFYWGIFDGETGIEVYDGITEVTVPKTVKNICSDAFWAKTLQNIFVDKDNEYFTAVDGVLFTKSLYTMIQYPTSSTKTEYAIPDETHQIAHNAIGLGRLYDNSGKISLERLTIGKNVDCFGIKEYQDKEPIGWIGGNIIVGALQSIANVLSGDGKIIVSDENTHYATDGKAIYSANGLWLYCFFDKSITEYTMPADIMYIDKTGANPFDFLPLLERINVEDGNTCYSAVDGVLYDYTKTQILHVPNSIMGHVTIPDSVTSIRDWAFSGCSGLTSITIPDRVESIGSYAFEGCSGLTSITIPDNVTSIGEFAFYECSGLTSVAIGNSVTSIDYCAFSGCSGLTSVTMPDSVTSIGNYAFDACDMMETVFYAGTAEQWEAISIGDGNNVLKYAQIVFAILE